MTTQRGKKGKKRKRHGRAQPPTKQPAETGAAARRPRCDEVVAAVRGRIGRRRPRLASSTPVPHAGAAVHRAAWHRCSVGEIISAVRRRARRRVCSTGLARAAVWLGLGRGVAEGHILWLDDDFLRAAATAYTQLLTSSSSDNNIKLIVLGRLGGLRERHLKVLQDLTMDLLLPMQAHRWAEDWLKPAQLSYGQQRHWQWPGLNLHLLRNLKLCWEAL